MYKNAVSKLARLLLRRWLGGALKSAKSNVLMTFLNVIESKYLSLPS